MYVCACVSETRSLGALCVITQDADVAERSAATSTCVWKGLWRAQLTNIKLAVRHIKWGGGEFMFAVHALAEEHGFANAKYVFISCDTVA